MVGSSLFAAVPALAATRVTVSERVVSVRSSVPATVRNPRQVTFLDARSRPLRWRQLTRGYRRVQRFTVSSPVAVVRLGSHALRRRDGRWLAGRTVKVATRQPALSAPVSAVGPVTV